MDVKDIKPIPKYIMDAIYKRDLKIEPWQTNYVRYYAYLTIWKKELIKVTVAVTNIKNKYWACKQVAVHGIHSEYCFVRDMEYNYFGNGFRVGWYAEELQSQQKQFEDGKWHAAQTKYYDPYATLINRSVVGKFPEYKYSAYQLYNGRDIINYLRIYEQYPQTEYLLKLGLGAYAENRSLLKKIAKDKAFRKWIARKRQELALPYGNSYNFTTVMQAYKTGLPLKEGHPVIPLQLLYLQAERLLRQIQPLRRPGYAQVLGDLHKIRKTFQIHPQHPPFSSLSAV